MNSITTKPEAAAFLADMNRIRHGRRWLTATADQTSSTATQIRQWSAHWVDTAAA